MSSLPLAIAIAALGGGVTLWAVYRSIVDQRHARTFRQNSIDEASPEVAAALEGLFAAELELVRFCGGLKGQDWVVGRRLIHAAEVVVHDGLSEPDACRVILEQALENCRGGNLEGAWAILTAWTSAGTAPL